MPRLLPTPSGSVVGGAAANCVSLALELKRRGVDVELLTSISHEDVERLERHLREMIRPVSAGGAGLLGKGLGALCSLRRGLARRLSEKRFDVVHSHSGTYPYAVVPLATDRRTCVRLHSLYCPIGAEGGVYSRWWEKPVLVRMVSRRLDRIVAVTGNVGRSLMEAGVSASRIESIPMCVDTRRFHPGERGGSARFFPDSGDAIRLLHVGNASREKGLIPLLHAVRLLLDKGTRVFLVAAVENQSNVKEYATGYQTAKQRVEEWGIGGHVRFLGLVDRIEDLYAESDILVIPWETSRGPSDYPMVALEAMAMGKCVVATPVGGCPELLLGGDAGVLAGGFSSAEIAAAIELATKNARHREKRSEQAARRRADEFSVIACVDRHLAVYERLSREKARS